MADFVNAYGQPINPYHTPSALAPKKKAPPVAKLTGIDHQDEMSLGFAVEGWRPEDLTEARTTRAKEIAEFASVRSKPYEIRSSADECAQLATRAGWLRVRVTEIRRQRKG